MAYLAECGFPGGRGIVSRKLQRGTILTTPLTPALSQREREMKREMAGLEGFVPGKKRNGTNARELKR
jgi:hypothetical protein